jgi:anthranilate phosphoribosyltransferase
VNTLRDLVTRVADGASLTEAEAAEAMTHLISGDASPTLAAALLTALRLKGETAAELTGFARVMRENSIRIAPRCPRLVDTCGTGGGGVPTFNISTAAAFVAAGAGVAVAKHGNRAMTSKCGSADVLEALGVRLDLPPAAVCAGIEQVGIGFLFAQAHHPAMRFVAPIRRELPFRTLFNCLGPLTNPAGARNQVIGVFDPALVPLLAEVLARLGTDRALVVHGVDGLDEVSTLGVTRAALVQEGRITELEWTPEEFGLARAPAAALAPAADPAGNAELLRGVLEGEAGPRRDVVLLNAAAALWVADAAADLPAALESAARSVDSGAATGRLEALREWSRANAD